MAVGNVGQPAELRYTPNGAAVANFTLAVNRVWKDKDGQKQKETTWLRCTVWGAYAETMAQYITKGKPLSIRGRLSPDQNTGGPKVYQKNDGGYGAQYEINIDEIGFVSGVSNGNGNNSSSMQPGRIDLNTPAPETQSNDEVSFLD